MLPPPGMELPEELAAPRFKAITVGARAATAAGGAVSGGGVGTGGYATRQRQSGHSDGPCLPMFDDPEALLRKTRMLQQQRDREQQQVSAAGCAQAVPLPAYQPVDDLTQDDAKEATSPVGKVDMLPPSLFLMKEQQSTGPAAVGAQRTGADSSVDRARRAHERLGDISTAVRFPARTSAGAVSTRRVEVMNGGGVAEGGVTPESEEKGKEAEVSPPGKIRQAEDAKRESLGRDAPDLVVLARTKTLLERTVSSTAGWSMESLEMLYARAAALVLEHSHTRDRRQVVMALEDGLASAMAIGGRQ